MMKEMFVNEIGGRKSKYHIAGQYRLQKICYPFFNTEIEAELPTKEKTYYADILLTVGLMEPRRVAVLEVDTYKYGSQKKKSPTHIKQRDKAIMEFYHIPVIRIDVDALKEGRSETKYFQTNGELFDYIMSKLEQWKKDPDEYMNEVQRG